ncbi:MAG: universal stress protein [Burkholderiaceae bacterium]
MRVTCGTDFSERGREAAEVAALLAARSQGRLFLVHGLDTRGAVLGAAPVLQALETAARTQLERETEHLRSLGAEVEAVMPDGWPDEAILNEAERNDSELIVLAATGARDGPGVPVGKTCERSLARTRTPMLVVRDPRPLSDWLRGGQPLRLMIAFDFSPQAAAALSFASRFARIGNCRIVVAYVDDPQREARRMGLSGGAANVQASLREALARRVAESEPDLPAEIVVSPHLGDPGSRLAHLAERERIDLVISGTHQRGPIQRLFAGSVSLQLLRDAPSNLIIVPATDAALAAATTTPRAVRSVLVATDLSELGNRAVSQAIAIAPAGATVHIVHVISPNQMLDGAYGRPSYASFEAEHAAERKRRLAALEALLPDTARDAGNEFVCRVVGHEQPAQAIIEQAEHFDVDLVCVGTLGRSGLAATLLGSIAQDVLKRLRGRPLLLVPPEPN